MTSSTIGTDAALAVVDHEALRNFLTEHVQGVYDGELHVSLLAGGASNLTFLVRLDDRELVVRRRPLGKSAPRAHDMKREFTAISALAPVGFPVAPALAYSDDRSVVGEPFYVMGRVAGRALHSSADAHSLPISARAAVGEQLIATLAQLHTYDVDKVGLGKFGRPEGFLERRIRSWARQWDTVEHRDYPRLHEIGIALLERLPAEGMPTIVHGDYRLGNVLFAGLDEGSGRGPRLTGVLDWEMSTVGDPLTDLAHLLVYWEPTFGRVLHPAQEIANLAGFPSGDQIAQQYAALSGRDLSTLGFYLVFEHWRAAIIKDAIYLRAKGLGTVDAATEALGHSVAGHLAEAHEGLSRLR